MYENGFLDHCVSAIIEFSGNEFELGENKIEREREPIIFLYERGPLNSVIIFRKRHNISERYDFGTRSVTIFRKDMILVRENILKSDLKMLCFYDFMFRWICNS